MDMLMRERRSTVPHDKIIDTKNADPYIKYIFCQRRPKLQLR